MQNKKLFAWILIIVAALLVSMVIIFPPTLIFSGYQKYQENVETNAENQVQPDAVVQAFYDWYLTYEGNPIVERAYQDSDLLTPSFVEHVDEVLAGFSEQTNYDPFLCAQDRPEWVMVDSVYAHGEQTSLLMRSSFPGHVMTIDLQKLGDGWKIASITCAATPEGTARAFYTWYLAYIGDLASDPLRIPLADKAYRESGFLTEKFIMTLDDLGAESFATDPILLAQDIPHGFSVDPGIEIGTAIVRLQFGKDTVRHVKVEMVDELGTWKIDSIVQADLPK